jgi:dTDP-L-rhamnose 4-epimerase
MNTDLDMDLNTDLNTGICIVTGGAGFIGTAIVEGLVARFARVIVVDILHPQIHKSFERPKSLPPNVEFIRGDVTDPATWDALLLGAKPSVIIHLAAETGTGQSLTESARHSHTNVCGTAVMLDALARHHAIPKRIVLSSSRAIYGEGRWRSIDGQQIMLPGQRSREQLSQGQWDFPGASAIPSSAATTPPAPVSVYGATKLAQEHLLNSWASAFDVELGILRLQNVYGPGQSLINSYTGILSLFCRLARQGLSIPLYEDGEMLRDFVLIDDVAAAILAVVDMQAPPRQPYDVGTGKPTSIATMAQMIAAFYGAPAPHVCGKYRFGDVRHAACTIDAITTDLGWVPNYTTDQGLALLSAWVDTQLSDEK